MASLRIAISRSVRSAAAAPQASRPTTFVRSYANKKDMSATQGQASPGTASNVGNPGSVSPDHQDIKKSRGLDSEGAQDTKSVHTPASGLSGSGTGMQEEDSSTQKAFKQDPDAPDSEKRKNIEEKGQRPLDAADK